MQKDITVSENHRAPETHFLPSAHPENQCCPCSSLPEENGSCPPLRMQGEEKASFRRQPFVTGAVNTSAGEVPRVHSRLSWRDHAGSFKVRWGIGRMNYRIAPGLYAIGQPGPEDHVFVTANYKMSFDRLRKELAGRNGWILVLDTKGVNVWCAAGKGTFGTEELVNRIRLTSLEKVVTHRALVVPQLGAPGIAAHKVRKVTGFKVLFGPVMASDLPAFLDAGLVATRQMRRKNFPAGERIVLIPVDLVSALKWAVILLPLFYLASGLADTGEFWNSAEKYGASAVLGGLVGIFGGTVLTPLLLPFLPGRAFSVKGLLAGMPALILLHGFMAFFASWPLNPWDAGIIIMVTLSVSSSLGMNFTGASTYTSLSGVKKEMRLALPLQITGLVLGAGLWLARLIIVGFDAT